MWPPQWVKRHDPAPEEDWWWPQRRGAHWQDPQRMYMQNAGPELGLGKDWNSRPAAGPRWWLMWGRVG